MTIGDLIAQAAEFIYDLWPFRIVHEWEQGVRLRCGRVVSLLGPGLHIFWPLIGEIHARNTILDVNVTDNQTVDTADGVSVTFALAVKYRIADLARLYRSIVDHDSTVLNEVTASAAALAMTMNYDEIEEELPDAVWRDVHERLEEWGVELISVSLYTYCQARTFRVLLDQ